MSIDFFDCLKHDLDICIKTLISSRNKAFRCALILSSRERGIPSPYFVLLNIGKRTHLYLPSVFVEECGIFVFFLGGGRGLLSSSFSFAPFERYLKNPGSNFHLSPVYLQASQIYMFYNDNLLLVVTVKPFGDSVAKTWQLRKNHSDTGGFE